MAEEKQPMTAKEAATSEGTQAAIERFSRAVVEAIKSGRFDIVKLGTLYEDMGRDFPLTGQYLELRDYLFAMADKAGFGPALRLVYHAGETGARVTAALTAQAAILAASNYGAGSATTLAVAAQIGAMAGPIGIGVAVAAGVLTSIFGGESPEEAQAHLREARTAARETLKRIASSSPEVKAVLYQLEFVKSLQAMANRRIDDPLGWITDPVLREQLRLNIYNMTGKLLDDPAILSAATIRNLKPRKAAIIVKPSHVIWTGPVGSADVKGATVPGATVHFFSCLGDRAPKCLEIVESWADKDGRRIPGMLAKLKIAEPSPLLYFGAFSAGGHILKRLCLNDADRAMIGAMFLADGMYIAEWSDKARTVAPPIEGFVKLGVDAVRDGRIFVATASSSANIGHATGEPITWPSGAQSLEAVRLEVERITGEPFADVTSQAAELFPGLKPPAKIWRSRNVLFADFQAVYRHEDHAKIVAPVVWQTIPGLFGLDREDAPPPAPEAPPSPPATPGPGSPATSRRTPPGPATEPDEASGDDGLSWWTVPLFLGGAAAIAAAVVISSSPRKVGDP